MEHHVSQEMISTTEIVFSGVLEQSVELDYMLPDYCPNIFKVLKCRMEPKIISQRLEGSKLMIDGVALIQLIYVSEDSGCLRQLEQKQAFTKTAELKEDCTGGIVNIRAKCDYLNCRAVNSRRLDIRGALSLKTTVSKPKVMRLLGDCSGLQIHRKEYEYCENPMQAVKDFTIKETLEIGHGKPPVQEVLHYGATACLQDVKVLANKLVCKGELRLHTLYLCSQSPERPEVIEHTIPISQIVDVKGVDEDCSCTVSFEVTRYDLDLQIEEDGECHSFSVEIGVRAICEAGKNRKIAFADDAYSTCYETEPAWEQVKLCRLNRAVRQTVPVQQTIQLEQGLNQIFDLMYDMNGVSWNREDGCMKLTAVILISVLASDGDGMPICIEKTIQCDGMLEGTDRGADACSFEPSVQLSDLSYHLTATGELEIRGNLELVGMLYELSYLDVLTDIKVLEDTPKKRGDNCALRIYYADAGENVWEIAKKYNTSVTAILEENALEQEKMASRGMILIPIVDE